ncbi:MAG: hypothetical protein QOK48_1688 [Blastocatellia bacterium]|jgi:hypothetical protein|nr:hypothetical protein [Blastocatellia bacterium]
MIKKESTVFRITLLCSLIATGILISFGAAQSNSLTLARPADPVKEIAGYRNWTRVNAEPQLMPDQTAQLCAAPAPINAKPAANPHAHKYLTVYVNDRGRRAMLEQKKPAFPEGSIIVKEKLTEKTSSTPELLTVMIKRGKGFNSTSGDWEYMVVDGSGTNVTAQGKLENCQSCHSARPATDYVFRTYLPSDVLTRLK